MQYLDEWRKYIEKFLNEQINHYKSKQKIENVLEIGYGTSSDIIKKHFPQTIIIDNWIHKTWHGIRKVDLCEQIPDDMIDFFDLISCIEVLEHSKYPWIAAQSLIKMIKKDGIILVSVPSLFEHHPGSDYPDLWRFMPGHIEYLFPNIKILYQNNAVFNKNLTGMVYTLQKTT